jgi:tRNA pseudouridine55 synthase
LRRVVTGPFVIDQCVTLASFEGMDEQERVSLLRPVDVLLSGHPVIELEPDDAGRFLSGLRRRGPWHDQAAVRVYGRQPRALLGTGHVKAGELIPTRLLSPVEIEQVLKQ